MKNRIIVEYDYPVEHKPPVKADIYLHGDKVTTGNIKPLQEELEEIKAEIDKDRAILFYDTQKVEVLDEWIKILDNHIKELKGETMSKNDEFIEMLESIKTEIKNESGIGFDGEHYIDIPEVNTIIDRYIGELKGENK